MLNPGHASAYEGPPKSTPREWCSSALCSLWQVLSFDAAQSIEKKRRCAGCDENVHQRHSIKLKSKAAINRRSPKKTCR